MRPYRFCVLLSLLGLPLLPFSCVSSGTMTKVQTLEKSEQTLDALAIIPKIADAEVSGGSSQFGGGAAKAIQTGLLDTIRQSGIAREFVQAGGELVPGNPKLSLEILLDTTKIAYSTNGNLGGTVLLSATVVGLLPGMAMESTTEKLSGSGQGRLFDAESRETLLTFPLSVDASTTMSVFNMSKKHEALCSLAGKNLGVEIIKTLKERLQENASLKERLVVASKSRCGTPVFLASGQAPSTPAPATHDETTKVKSSSPVREKWALVIGVGKYADPKIEPLPAAAADARMFADWLTAPEGGNFSKERVKVLIDEEATRLALTDAFSEWLRQPIAEDLVTIYIACHGAPADATRPKELYLFPYDTKSDMVSATAVPMVELKGTVESRMYSRKVLLFADACHSGGIGSSYGLRGAASNSITNGLKDLGDVKTRGFAGTTTNPVLPDDKRERFNDSVFVFSASSGDQLSQEGAKWGGGHGVFTYYLLEGLKGAAKSEQSGKVTLGSLVNYVNEHVSEDTKNAQTPMVAGYYDLQLRLRD